MHHRHVQLGACGLSFSVYQSERLARGVLFDLAVDPAGGRAVAVGQDGQVRLFDVATGRAIRNFSAAPDCGEPGGGRHMTGSVALPVVFNALLYCTKLYGQPRS